MSTVPATKLLDGMGVVYNPSGNDTPATDAANIKYLASIGVHDIRIELPWDAVDPANETRLLPQQQTRYRGIFAACAKYGIRPTVLLNANDGRPQPTYPTYQGTVVGTPAPSDSQITVSGIPASDIVVHQPNTATGSSGISYSNDAGEAGNLITGVVTNPDRTLTLTLSRPLDRAPSGHITMFYLKYMPLYPVGTAEFNNTVAGWLQYARTATNSVETAGVHNFSVEIWNELTFGSAFLNINDYYPSSAPLVPNIGGPGISGAALRSGGNIWELANETNQYLKKAFGNSVTVIWGFSNTTFYDPGPSQLPADINGLSYHPYGAGLEPLSSCVGAGARYLQGGPYIPEMTLSPAEGCEAMGFKIENLPRGALSPSKNQTHNPLGTRYLNHYITETGDDPAELGVTGNPSEAQLLKSKAALRSYSFWLNKGIDQFDWFSAFDNKTDDSGFNLLAVGSDSGGNPQTQQSRTVGHFASQFAGAVKLSEPRSLGVKVRDITANDNTSAYQVFPSDPTTGEPALNYRTQFQFLPFQETNNKFVIPVYVMSWNLIHPPPPMKFRLNISGVDGKAASVSYYDPITNKSQPVTVVSRNSSNIIINIEAVDDPRTISISRA